MNIVRRINENIIKLRNAREKLMWLIGGGQYLIINKDLFKEIEGVDRTPCKSKHNPCYQIDWGKNFVKVHKDTFDNLSFNVKVEKGESIKNTCEGCKENIIESVCNDEMINICSCGTFSDYNQSFHSFPIRFLI